MVCHGVVRARHRRLAVARVGGRDARRARARSLARSRARSLALARRRAREDDGEREVRSLTLIPSTVHASVSVTLVVTSPTFSVTTVTLSATLSAVTQ